MERYFLTNALFREVETDFLASKNYFLYNFSETPASENFFPSIEKAFFKKFIILAIVEGFFL